MATVNMENWMKTRGGGYQSQEDPVPMEEVPPEIGHPQIKGGLGDKTPDQLENIISLADNHLDEIEEEEEEYEDEEEDEEEEEMPVDWVPPESLLALLRANHVAHEPALSGAPSSVGWVGEDPRLSQSFVMSSGVDDADVWDADEEWARRLLEGIDGFE